MTTASEVHLFSWMKEKWEILITFFAVFWAMTVFWMRTVADKFYTRAEIDLRIDERIDNCKRTVDLQDKNILNEVKKVAGTIEKMDERQRNDAKINTDKHEELIREVGKLHGKMDG